MNTNRTGKIARLPKEIRDDFATRLANGESGKKLVDWPNRHGVVQEVLEEY